MPWKRPAGPASTPFFDCVGGATVVKSIPAMRPFGRLATILGAQGALTPLYVNNQTLHGVLLLRERARLDELSLLLDRGQIKPLVDAVLDLGQVGEAHERLESGHGRGKVVLGASENYRSGGVGAPSRRGGYRPCPTEDPAGGMAAPAETGPRTLTRTRRPENQSPRAYR